MATYGDILLYKTEDGQTKLDVTVLDDTVWLSQAQLVALFQSSKANISEHITSILAEKELHQESVVRNFRTTATDGKRYDTKHYNLDMIIAVGYRVKSPRATQFRQWATERLKEYIIKGFAMNDDVLKNNGYTPYFDELLGRIRDIRSSEKVFWRSVLRIYASSIDYDKNTEESLTFFKTVQNKMHWAAHGHTAAEVIYDRVSAEKPNMGLTSIKGKNLTKQDTHVAKNYLTAEELDVLNRLVTMYLDYAELQAMRRTPMTMKDWITKLDDFIKMTDNAILEHKGSISNDSALRKADAEYEKFKIHTATTPSQVEQDMENVLKSINAIARTRTRKNT